MLTNPSLCASLSLFVTAFDGLPDTSTIEINSGDITLLLECSESPDSVNVCTDGSFESFDDCADAIYCVSTNTYNATFCVLKRPNPNYIDGHADFIIFSRDIVTCRVIPDT